jgi:hypothetical protein
MPIESQPLKQVKITRKSSRSVFALVNSQYKVWIRDLGTDNFMFTCSCDQWSIDVGNGKTNYCNHYLAVIAKLLLEKKVKDSTKINLLDEQGVIKVNEYKTILREISQNNALENAQLIEEGKTFLCPYCTDLLDTEIFRDPLQSMFIKQIKSLPRGYIINGIGRCNRCGVLLARIKKIPIELSSLTCPSCGKNYFKAVINETKKLPHGYEFSIELICRERNCSWKKNLKSGIMTVGTILNKLKKIKVSQTGLELEMKDASVSENSNKSKA